MTSIHRIPSEHVELGMFVSETTPGLKQTGLNQRGLISRSETLTTLKRSRIQEIHIDVSKGKASEYATPVVIHNPEPTASLDEERERAERVYDEARSLVGNVIHDVKLGNAIDVGPIESVAEDISESVLANANALACLSQIREKDKYLLEHSINVGILMGVFTRFLGYQREQIHQMVTGAILHDMGKIRVPTDILNKPGKLTDAEWQEMRNHVLYGEEVLIKSEGISDVALAICAQHHEKLNGKGYPRGLQQKEVSIYGRLASVVDIYDAITADRVYHRGKSPFEAMRILASLGKEELDQTLVYQFIRCMSVYPVGTLLELSNRKLGIVTQVRPQSPNQPIVKCFCSMYPRAFDKRPTTIDLSQPGCTVSIVAVHDPVAMGIIVKNFI